MRALLLSSAGDGLTSPSPDHGRETQQSAAAGEQQQAISVDSDMVVILASLLCALISVVGLALVARCACRRRQHSATVGSSSSSSSAQAPPPAKGLKKKAMEALPTVSFVGGRRDSECAICLAEFAEGEQLRVLPHCAHAFHVACIDTWLGAHASCPSCRAAIVELPPGRCRRCGASCDLDVGAAAVAVRGACRRAAGNDDTAELPLPS